MARRRKRKGNATALLALLVLPAFGLWPWASLIVCLLCIFAFALFAVHSRAIQLGKLRAFRLADVDNMAGHAFEHYVARLLEYQGFTATVTKGSGDLGIDIIAAKDGSRYAVQCKRYNGNIPRTAVSDAVAGKQHYGCGESMVVTNRSFTPGAKVLAKSTHCVLVDRDTLASWIHNFQHQNVHDHLVQEIKRIFPFGSIKRVFVAVVAFALLLLAIQTLTIFFAR